MRKMGKLIELSPECAKQHFLKAGSYFSVAFPAYISFEKILTEIDEKCGGRHYKELQIGKKERPHDSPGVNYNFSSNKDGRFAWRPFELIHPVIYVSLVNQICKEQNWKILQERFKEIERSSVTCCSIPVVSSDGQSDTATQVRSWWQEVEQRSLEYSLEFSHVLHTDVTDCYGSLYTHSIAWAIHGLEESKKNKREDNYLGNQIDDHIKACRYGQTNGIPQGSVLMDFIAELVLGYVDQLISDVLKADDYVLKANDFRILRYRDDYRIFANSDDRGEEILKVISDQLRKVGMKLGVSKTHLSRNVVEGSVKPDKLAGIDQQDLGEANAKTIQKKLLRLHSFGQRYPNSGALKRLISEYSEEISKMSDKPDDLPVLIAIATDIAFVSPSTIPAIAGILSHLLSLTSEESVQELWQRIHRKMKRMPYNGYLEVWLQRIIISEEIPFIEFESDEPICKIVNGENGVSLWGNEWIQNSCIIEALDVKKIIIGNPRESSKKIKPDEYKLFTESANAY